MLLGESSGDPDDCHCLQARSICQQLTEVGVVGLFELILDENPVARLNIFTENVCPKRSNITLLGF